MNTRKNHMFLALLLAGAMAILAPQASMAASTEPCTHITNVATIDYTVGGAPQTQIPSVSGPANEFWVGAKVIVSVTNNDGANVTVTPGATPAVLKYTVKNDGNAVQDYQLAVVADAANSPSPYGGGNDSFDGTTVNVYVDSNGNGTYDAGVDTATTIDNLARDGGTKTVFIVYTPTDLTASKDAIAVYMLKATSQWANGGAIGAQGVQSLTNAKVGGTQCGAGTNVDVVFGDGSGPATGDGNRDAMASDDGAYVVSNAAIGITKTKSVVWDPINFNTTPKAIPGAIVKYSVTVANTGSAAATLTTIGDNLDTTNLSLVTTYYDGGLGTAVPTSSTGKAFIVTCAAVCGARACEAAGGTAFTSAAADDAITFATPAITATMNGATGVLPTEGACVAGSLGATDTVTIDFQVTIK